MMKYIIFLTTLLLTSVSYGQKLKGYEYFFNTDPGIDSGIYVAITPTLDYNANINVSLNNVPLGLNIVGIRFKDSTDNWSTVQYYSFINETGNNNTPQKMVAYEYFFNTDPGIGNGQNVSLNTPTDSFNDTVTINTTNLPLGLNNLGIRFKDNRGLWSVTQLQSFINEEGNGKTEKINALEVFFNEEPGVGNGIIVALPETNHLNQTVNVPIPTALAQDGDSFKVVYVRVRNGAGLFSLYQTDTTTLEYIVTGIEDLTKQGFHFYPNPSKGYINLNIDNDNTGIFQFQIYDLNGKLCMNKQLKKLAAKEQFTIDCSQLAVGAYILKVQGENFQGNGKLIIQ